MQIVLGIMFTDSKTMKAAKIQSIDFEKYSN